MEQKTGLPKPGELEQINRFTGRELKEDEVYVFSLVLCDNDIDRDMERFSDEALEKLCRLYPGVTGVTDHEAKSCNQGARIISCRTEAVEGKLTSDGRPYRRLCARAYIHRSSKGQELIDAIEGGIKKEVSVGCAVRKKTCSLCGKDIEACTHIKGRRYGGKLCTAVLEDPTDAYEWSFVAVPSQRSAGVIKRYFPLTGGDNDLKNNDLKGGMLMDIEKKLFSGEEQSFTADEMSELAASFRELEKKAAEGEYYRDRLIKEVRGLSAVVFPELDRDTLCYITEGLTARQLDSLKKAFESRASDILPVKPQLARGGNAARSNQNYQNI